MFHVQRVSLHRHTSAEGSLGSCGYVRLVLNLSVLLRWMLTKCRHTPAPERSMGRLRVPNICVLALCSRQGRLCTFVPEPWRPVELDAGWVSMYFSLIEDIWKHWVLVMAPGIYVLAFYFRRSSRASGTTILAHAASVVVNFEVVRIRVSKSNLHFVPAKH